MSERSVHPRTVDHMRTIIDLAKSNSIVKTCENLGKSRGTIKTHLEELSARHDAKIFTVVGPEFKLTERGKEIASQAEILLRQLFGWQNSSLILNDDGKTRIVNSAKGYLYCQARSSVGAILKDEAQTFKSDISLWLENDANFHAEPMTETKVKSVIYRYNGTDWFTHMIGEKSLFTRFYGKEAQEQFIGMPVRSLPFGDETAPVMQASIEASKSSMSPIIDKIVTRTPKREMMDEQFMYYDRLTLPCYAFEDEVAIVSISKLQDHNEWSLKIVNEYRG